MRMYVSRLLILLVFLLGALRGSSQPDNIRFENIGNGTGLLQSSVMSICQDSFGLMWWGTHGGLVMYDGIRQKVYDVQNSQIGSNIINAVCQDGNANIIAATNSGLVIFERVKERFYRIPWKKERKIRCLQPIEGNKVWVGTETGLFLVDTKFQAITDSIPSLFVNALGIEKEGRLWIATNSGLYVRTGNQAPILVSAIGSRDANFTSVFVHPFNSHIYAGTFDGNLLLCEGKLVIDTIMRRTSPVSSMAVTNDSVLWVGFSDEGLILLRADTISQKFSGRESGPGRLQDHEVASLFRSKGGSMWVGTKNEGVFQYSDRRVIFESFGSETGNNSGIPEVLVWSICRQDETHLWVGTNANGVFEFENKTGIFTAASNWPLSHEKARSLLKDSDGNVWVGTGSGKLFRCTNCQVGGSFVLTSFRRTKSDIHIIRESLDGRYLFIGTKEDGLFVLEKGPSGQRFLVNFRTQGEMGKKLKDNNVYSLHADRNGKYVWIGTFGGDLMRLKLSDFSVKEIHYDLSDIGSADPITCIHQDSQNPDWLWIGTYSNGIERYSIKNDSVDLSITTENGLGNNSVYAIVEDEFGGLWISTNNGLSLYEPRSRSCRIFGPESGIAGREFNGGAFLKVDSNGVIYFGGIDGLTKVDIHMLKKTKAESPRVVFTGLEIGGGNVEVDSALHHSGIVLNRSLLLNDPKVPIEIDYHDQTMTIRFAGLDYAQMGNIKYRWQLERMDGAILRGDELLGNGEVELSSLGYGDMRFVVEVANSNGEFDGSETSKAELMISIAPPIWSQAWFWIITIVFATVIICFLGFAYSRYSGRNELARQALNLEKDFGNQKEELIIKQAELVSRNDELRIANDEVEKAKNELELKMDQLEKSGANERSARQSQEKANKELVFLNEIGKIASNHVDLDQMVDELARIFASGLNLEVFAIGINKPTEDIVSFDYIYKFTGKSFERKAPKSLPKSSRKAYTVETVRLGKIFKIDNAQKEKEIDFERDSLYGKDIQSILCYPLMSTNARIGSIVLMSTDKRAFSTSQSDAFFDSIILVASAGIQSCIQYGKIKELMSRQLTQSKSLGHDVKHLFRYLKDIWVHPPEKFFDLELVDSAQVPDRYGAKLLIPRENMQIIQQFGIVPYKVFIDTLSRMVFVWTGRMTDDLIQYKGRTPLNLEEAILACWEFSKEVMCMTALGKNEIKNIYQVARIEEKRATILKLYPMIEFPDANEFSLWTGTSDTNTDAAARSNKLGVIDEFPHSLEYLRNTSLQMKGKDNILRLIATLCLNTLKHCCPASKSVKFYIRQDASGGFLEVAIVNEVWPDKLEGRIGADPLSEIRKKIEGNKQHLLHGVDPTILDTSIVFLLKVRDEFSRVTNTSGTASDISSEKFNTPEILASLLSRLRGEIIDFGFRTIDEERKFLTHLKISVPS